MKSRRKARAPLRASGAPFLHRVESLPEKLDPTEYPFNVPAFSHGIDLTFRSKVTFLVGENGTGKSTLLEAPAECCGFNPDHPGNRFRDRNHFLITRDFLNSPERFFKHLLGTVDDDGRDA